MRDVFGLFIVREDGAPAGVSVALAIRMTVSLAFDGLCRLGRRLMGR